MNRAEIAKQLQKLYRAEIAKLLGMVERLEQWVDAGLEFRRDLDTNIANLRKAITDLDAKIDAANRGEAIGDDWWRGN